MGMRLEGLLFRFLIFVVFLEDSRRLSAKNNETF